MSDLKEIFDRLGIFSKSKNNSDIDYSLKGIQDILDDMKSTSGPLPPVARNTGSSGYTVNVGNSQHIGISGGGGGFSAYSGSSGFSGYSGRSGFLGYPGPRSFTEQEIIDAYLAGYQLFNMLEEEIKPEVIEFAKKYAKSL